MMEFKRLKNQLGTYIDRDSQMLLETFFDVQSPIYLLALKEDEIKEDSIPIKDETLYKVFDNETFFNIFLYMHNYFTDILTKMLNEDIEEPTSYLAVLIKSDDSYCLKGIIRGDLGGFSIFINEHQKNYKLTL